MNTQEAFRTPYIWHNGEFISWESAQVHSVNHSLHYGSGAFEGIRFYDTQNGPQIFRLPDHIERLFYSANAMGIHIPYTKQELIDACIQTVQKSGAASGYIRPIVYRGIGEMGLKTGKQNIVTEISVWAWGAYLSDDPISVKISTWRHIAPETADMNAKVCGYYANNIMASNEVSDDGFDEGLLLDIYGYIAEGPWENIFFVDKEGKVYTPKQGSILPGITRSTIMEVLEHDFDTHVQEVDITPKDLELFEEAFFTGTAAEITPIKSIMSQDNFDQIFYKSWDKQSLTIKVKHAYKDIVTGKNSEYNGWLS